MPFFCIHCKSEIDSTFKACPFCGEPITDFLRRHLESPLDGKYQILSRLGVGGMGEVYKVLHVHLNSIRVIKLMRSNIASDPGAHERFLREARLATRIHHPSVATLFDFSTLDDGSHYMVWEFIEGTNLHELIDQKGPLSPRYAAQISVQALMGLDAIHRAGIVHRDVSPENLMITRGDEGEERVKIIDLGIAKSSATEDNKTKTGMFVGKWKYCSPEHLGMLPPGERIDGRADLYSFGIVLYEMLAGVPPFQADTPHAYLMMHSSEAPRAVREVNPWAAVPPQLEALLMRALEKDRKKRFASAREFAKALEQLAPSLSDDAGVPPPLATTAEITYGSTAVAPRADLSTLASVDQATPTIVTDAREAVPKTIEHDRGETRASEQAVTAVSERAAGTRRMTGVVAAAIAIMMVAVAGWYVWQNRTDVEASVPAVQEQATVTVPVSATVPTSARGRISINAFPWANITSIRNLESGAVVETGDDLTTPTPVEVAPGRYEITLTNPAFERPITRIVTVAAGADELLTVHFSDPDTAVLPDFGGQP